MNARTSLRSSSLLLERQRAGDKLVVTGRHGKATKNEKLVIDGQEVDTVGGRAIDSPLTKSGRELDAVRLGQRWMLLRAMGIINADNLHVRLSPAKRTQETWRIASKLAGLDHIVPVLDENLLELDEDPTAGQPKDRTVTLPDGTEWRYVPYADRDLDNTAGGVESLASAMQRTMTAYNEIADSIQPGETALVVAHGVAPMRLGALAMSGDTSTLRGKQPYCGEALYTQADGIWTPHYFGLPTAELDAPVNLAAWVDPQLAARIR